uniref:Uncharacterized protein n=1 Tax=Anguilla anguilla TaxID=7936 RepID=A0A0E9TRX5_ANGAN
MVRGLFLQLKGCGFDFPDQGYCHTLEQCT